MQPPGTGKSFLGKALLGETEGVTFFSISTSNVVSRYLGDSEQFIRELFEVARERKPSIIFIDEIDILGSKKADNTSSSFRSVTTELLTQMDGIGKVNDGVFVIGTTNYAQDLDCGILRRFTMSIYVGLPDMQARRNIFQKNVEESLSDEKLDKLAKRSSGYVLNYD